MDRSRERLAQEAERRPGEALVGLDLLWAVVSHRRFQRTGVTQAGRGLLGFMQPDEVQRRVTEAIKGPTTGLRRETTE